MPNFDRLMSQSLWESIVYVMLGYVAATAMENVVSGRTSTAIPAEAYGAGTILVLEMATSGSLKRYSQMGAGFHTVESLAERLNLKGTLYGVGA